MTKNHRDCFLLEYAVEQYELCGSRYLGLVLNSLPMPHHCRSLWWTFPTTANVAVDGLHADVLRKAVEKAASSRHSTTQLRPDSLLVTSTCHACSVYLAAMETLTQLRLNIVAGITPTECRTPLDTHTRLTALFLGLPR